MLHPVEDDRANGYLAAVGFASRLGGNGAGQEIYVAGGSAGGPGGAAGAGNADGGQRFRTGDAVYPQTVFLLELDDGILGLCAVNAVHVAEIVAPLLELRLNLPDLFAAGTVFG